MFRRPIRRGSCPPVLLDYVDGQGERSMRTIAPVAVILKRERVTSPQDLYLEGRCSTAKALRTFRADRIASLADAATGELLNLSAWLDNLQLGEANAFAWPTNADAGSSPSVIEENETVEDASWRPSRWLTARTVAIALVIGYLIGRLRTIRWLLHLFHGHKGLWL